MPVIRPLAKVDLRPPTPPIPRGDPMPPQFWGEPNSKSPNFGGFRGHSRIYARGLFFSPCFLKKGVGI